MSDVAISVENISKCYRIGTQGGPAYHRLSEMITGVPRALWNVGRSMVRPGLVATPENSDAQNSGEFWALKDVSFEIKQGEVVGIIGRNGAGKSTLLKILSRITEPTSGRFGIRGRVASLLEVGTGFHPELTGRENIYVSGVTLGMTRAEIKKRFDEIVDFSGVQKFLDTPVKHYSSGMQVRLGFAVAAHLESEILIVDEVLAVGDAEFQKRCTGKLHSLSNSGRTVIFVSHNLTALKALCSSACWLDHGNVRKVGNCLETTDLYVSQVFAETDDVSWHDLESCPGNDAIRLKCASVTPAGQHNGFLLSNALEMRFEFCVLEQGPLFTPSVVVQSADGQIVFNTFPFVDCSTLSRLAGSRLVAWRCVIPAGLLNSQKYRVQLYAIRDRSHVEWKIDDLLSFELHDDTERNGWHGEWTGVVRPILQWNMDQS